VESAYGDRQKIFGKEFGKKVNRFFSCTKQMNPSVWGSCTWKTIHLIGLGYPKEPNDEDKHNYRTFFMNFYKVIPCYKCSINYQRHLHEAPIDNYLRNNDTLFEWTVILHNLVNKEIGKKEISVEHAKRMFLAQSTSFNMNVVMSILLALLVAIIVYVLCKWKKI